MDLREQMLANTPGSSKREKLIIAMMTGALDSLIAGQKRLMELMEMEGERLQIFLDVPNAGVSK